MVQKQWLALACVAFACLSAVTNVEAQPVRGVCTACADTPDRTNCGMCIANGTACFDTLPAAERRPGVFTTSDGRDARSLRIARLIKGAPRSEMDINRAVGRQYNGGNVWLYYGDGAPSGYCSPSGGPQRAFMTDAEYRFPWDRRYEDTLNALDCYNGEVDRFYIGVPGHSDGERVCDGEQAMFLPEHGAIFDLGGDGNRVAVFPFTDHGPLPCESFEFSVWLSNNPDATQIAEAGRPDANRWNPAILVRAFLQGWIPDAPAGGRPMGPPLTPDLANPTQRDGIVQVFALPCGLTFRYASVVAGNNGNPAPACEFWSFDAELDAVAGLNEDDTAICGDADGDGFRDRACGGNDCNDRDRAVNPSAVETCSSTRDLNCDGVMSMCPTNTTCINGLCAPQCVESACPEMQVCVTGDGGANYCLPEPCARSQCPAGQVCGPRGCQDPCEGARCPTGQVCRGGACVDPCSGVLCPPRQHCEAGRCAPNCPCVACGTGASCNERTGRCDAPGCGTLMCPAGTLLDCTGATARCATRCEGVVCPLGSRCEMASGLCVVDRCAGVSCPGGSRCLGGTCVRDARPDAGMDATIDASRLDVTTTTDTSMVGDTDTNTSMDAALDSGLKILDPAGNSGGCGCHTAETSRSTTRSLAAISLGVALLARRRSRRVIASRSR
jgi:hypothetical protein